jgi:hypothetical protein
MLFIYINSTLQSEDIWKKMTIIIKNINQLEL